MLGTSYDILAGSRFLLRVGASYATDMTGRKYFTYRIANLLLSEQPSLLRYISFVLSETLDLYLSGSVRLDDDKLTFLKTGYSPAPLP